MLLYHYYNIITMFLGHIKVNGKTLRECTLSVFCVNFNVILQHFLKCYKNGMLFMLFAMHFVMFGLQQCRPGHCPVIVHQNLITSWIFSISYCAFAPIRTFNFCLNWDFAHTKWVYSQGSLAIPSLTWVCLTGLLLIFQFQSHLIFCSSEC